MRVTYEHKSDAAYIYLTPIEPGGVRHTLPVQDPDKLLQGTIILDIGHD